jgi:hypothetical protein
MSITGVAVEKLSSRKSSEIASRQEDLQTIFRHRLDIFYYPNFGFLQKSEFFNSHRDYHHLPHSEIGGGKRISQQ